MSEWIDAQARYLRSAERRARAKGVSVTEYLETRTTLLKDEVQEIAATKPQPQQKPAVGLERLQLQAPAQLEIKQPELPLTDAVISICVAEPKGVYRFELSIPNIGAIFVDSMRNERGYKQAFIEAILYKFYGHMG